jgi:hypothetical protein
MNSEELKKRSSALEPPVALRRAAAAALEGHEESRPPRSSRARPATAAEPWWADPGTTSKNKHKTTVYNSLLNSYISYIQINCLL